MVYSSCKTARRNGFWYQHINGTNEHTPYFVQNEEKEEKCHFAMSQSYGLYISVRDSTIQFCIFWSFIIFITVYCDPIDVINCPNDIHKLVTVNDDYSSLGESPRAGVSVSWEPPLISGEKERQNSCQVLHKPPNRNPGNFFGIGVTIVTYSFSDDSGNEAICSFTVNITQG